MSNTVKLLTVLFLVTGLMMIEILVELLMPIAWLALIALAILMIYLMRQVYEAYKGDE